MFIIFAENFEELKFKIKKKKHSVPCFEDIKKNVCTSAKQEFELNYVFILRHKVMTSQYQGLY